MDEDRVILVDPDDVEIGTMSKSRAHVDGHLHRALSIFILDGTGRMLLQRRAMDKYHSGGLWTNACCSHPRPGEPVAEAARRRLKEELGITCVISSAFTFTYRAEVGNGLVEHEYDHVFFGTYDGPVHPDPAEVSEVRWVDMAALAGELRSGGEGFTAWFRICWPRVLERFLALQRA